MHSAFPSHALSTPARHVPPSTASASSKQVAQASVLDVKLPLAQYSVAQDVAQGPAPQMQAWTSATMSWKPVAKAVWQHDRHEVPSAAHIWSALPASFAPLLLPLPPPLLLPLLLPLPPPLPLPLLPPLLLPLASAHALAASDCAVEQSLQSAQSNELPSTVYVMDEHAPLESVAVHTFIRLPSAHVLPFTQDGPPPLPLLPPLLDPPPHAELADAWAAAQSWQELHWKDSPLPLS